MAGSGKCEACETINSGDINRDSGKGAFLPTILGSRDERLEKFGICFLSGKLPRTKKSSQTQLSMILLQLS